MKHEKTGVNYFIYNKLFPQRRLTEKEIDFNILKENYQMLLDPKFSQIKSSLVKLKENNSLEKEKQKLKKDMKTFYNYFSLYEKSDTILKKYKDNDFIRLFPDEKDTFNKIKEHIKFLNEIKINEVYKDLRDQEFEEENKDYKNLKNNLENEEKKIENLIKTNKDDITLDLRKTELEEMKVVLNQIKDIKQEMDRKIKEQGEILENIESNVVVVDQEKSEVLIKAKKELDKNPDNLKKKICILISMISIVVIVGLLGGIIAIVASK